MAATAGLWIAHVWRASSGKVIRRRAFKTDWGARNFAERESQANDVKEVSITVPHPQDGQYGPRWATVKQGQFITDKETATMAASVTKTATPAKTTAKKATAAKKPAASKKPTTKKVDEGTEVKKATPRRASTTAKPKPAVARTGKAVSWAEVLAMSDSKITKIDPGKRPNPSTLKGLKHADDSYTRSLVNFYTGERKHPVQACIYKLTSAEGMAKRNAIRKAIAAHVKVKPGDVRLETPGARTSNVLAPSAGGPKSKSARAAAHRRARSVSAVVKVGGKKRNARRK